MNFAAAICIILLGVQLILAEITPAFKGISEKLVPEARPAIDCPIIFPYAPNAVLIGFIMSFVGGIFGMILILSINLSFDFSLHIVLPGIVSHFFCGATSGVFANAEGGLKGTLLGSFFQGILLTFLPIFTMSVLGELGYKASTFSDTDFCKAGIVLGNIAKIVKGELLLMIIIAIFLFPIIYNVITNKN